MTDPRLIADSLTLPEGPRWHQGLLWFSDMHAHQVLAVTAEGEPVHRTAVDDACSGLGFFSNGDVAISAMHSRRVLRWSPDSGAITEWADLSSLATGHVNDLLVADDHIFVGHFGDGTAPPTPCRPSDLLVITPDGRPEVAAGDLHFANGMVGVGDQLIVAETRANPPRLSSFRRDGGQLSERTVLYEFDRADRMPDGICTDGANIWVASPFSREILQLSVDGTWIGATAVPQMPFAVAVNDDMLFVCLADDWRPDVAKASRSGRILALPR